MRHPEDDKGAEQTVKDRIIDLDKSQVFSPFLSSICEDAKGTTYISDADVRILAKSKWFYNSMQTCNYFSFIS